MVRISDEVQIGIAGEYIVCADLTMKGFISYQTMQGLPYDVLLDIGDRTFKVQVKTTLTYKSVPQRNVESKAYIFQIKRAGKNGTLRYTEDEIDIFALVALDTMQVGYILNRDMPSTINIRVDKYKGSYRDEKGAQDFKKAVELYKELGMQTKVADIMGLDIATINRYLRPGYKPFKTKAKYMSDYVRNKEWFYEI